MIKIGGEDVTIEGIKNCVRHRPSDTVSSHGNLAVLQKIAAEIEAKRNASQELWVSLRGFAVADMATVPLGLLRDVMEFCIAVFDSLEPNATLEERQRRIGNVNALAVPLNLRIGVELKKLSEKDNAFLGAWGAVAVTSMTALRQPNPNVRLILAPFSAFDSELQQVDQSELVLAVWLYSFYTTIFASVHGTIPAGILGVASLGIGLSVREVKGMV